jgi:hypothetical protein
MGSRSGATIDYAQIESSLMMPIQFDTNPSCSDLITYGHLHDYIPGFQLELRENSSSLLLTLADNGLGSVIGEKNMMIYLAAGIT